MTAARGHEAGARDRAWAIVHDPYDMDRPGVPLVTVPRDALVARIDAALQAAVQDVERHRDAILESFKEYQHRAQVEHSRLKTQLRAYTETVVMRPYKWLALQDADPVPMPEPEALDGLLRDAARAQALAAALEKVLACIRTTHVDMAGSTRNHYVLDSRRYAELTPEIRRALPPPQAAP